MKIKDLLLPKKAPGNDQDALKKASSSTETSNPFLSAKRSASEKLGETVTKIKTWQIFAVMEFILLLVMGGIVSTSIQTPKYIPYVVELDKLGTVVSSRPANSQFQVNEQFLKATVADFVTNLRLVTADIALQRDAIHRVYSHLNVNDPSRKICDEWYSVTPFERARESLVSIEIRSVLRQSDKTFQVEWVETVRTHTGEKVSASTMRALVNVYQGNYDNATDKSMRLNPLSIFVKDLSWTKLS